MNDEEIVDLFWKRSEDAIKEVEAFLDGATEDNSEDT